MTTDRTATHARAGNTQATILSLAKNLASAELEACKHAGDTSVMAIEYSLRVKDLNGAATYSNRASTLINNTLPQLKSYEVMTNDESQTARASLEQIAKEHPEVIGLRVTTYRVVDGKTQVRIQSAGAIEAFSQPELKGASR